MVMIGANGPRARGRRGAVRFAVTQDEHAGRDQRKREECADVCEVAQRADIEKSGGNADDEASDPGGKIRR